MRFLSCLWTCLAIFPFTLAMLVNVTVDDSQLNSQGDLVINYTSGGWIQGNTCSGSCTAHPDPTLVFDGTWHDSTFISGPKAGPDTESIVNVPINASLTFNGSAVYVICILATTKTAPDGDSDMTFFIDDEEVGYFNLPATGIPNYEYNVSVYSNDTLPAGVHTLRLQNGHVNGIKSLVLLDRIIYSFDNESYVDPEPSPPKSFSSSHKNKIIGGVLGTIIPLLFLAFGLLLYARYRRHRDRPLPFTNVPITTSERPPNRWDQIRGLTLRTVGSTPSFHPSLFVRRPIHDDGPPPVPNLPSIPSNMATVPSTSTRQPVIDLNSASDAGSERNVVRVVQEWQRRAQVEAEIPPPSNFAMSEVDLSTHYDDSTASHSTPVAAPSLVVPGALTVRNH